MISAVKKGSLDINNFSQHDFHPKSTDGYALNWIFIIDTLNFCFWTPGCDTKWKVDGQTGYFGLCAAINRAMKEGIDVTNPTYYSNISQEQLEHILRSDDGLTQCPLISERVKCLHEVAEKLLEKYDGKFENVIREAKNSAAKLLQIIVNDFPCFRDSANFNGQRVSIYKRAQILIGDVYACYRGESSGFFVDINEITMFADYRVPQVLVHFGALSYNDDLMADLKSDKVLLNGEPKEVEIRGASIHIIELVKKRVVDELIRNHPEVSTKYINSILLDHWAWDYRRAHAKELEYIPFHKTFSIYY